MAQNRSETYFFATLLLLTLVVVFILFLPFFNAIVLALTFNIIFNPLYRRLLSTFRGQETMAALAAIGLVIIIVLTPLIFFGYELISEARNLPEFGSGVTETVQKNLQIYFPTLNIKGYLEQMSGWIFGNIGDVFSGLTNFALMLFVSLFALYYLFKDGDHFKDIVMRASPLSNEHNEAILDRLHLAVVSVTRGTLLMAIIQGLSAGIGFAIFGVPNPVLWGAVTILAALVPAAGTALTIVPAAFYKFAVNEPVGGFGLLIWGTVVTGSLDNILRPYLLKRGIKIHPLWILLSILGGLQLFGVIGFLVGPLILSFLFTLIDIYPSIIGKTGVGEIFHLE